VDLLAVVNIREIDFIRVNVRDVIFMPSLDAPADQPFPFVYLISIENTGEEAATIVGRKWVVSEHEGSVTVVEGDGIVGETPRLEPGGVFAYNSYHTIGKDSTASGAYFARLDSGELVCVRIPEFTMKVPDFA